MSTNAQPAAVTALFGARTDGAPVFALPSPVYPPAVPSGDNGLVDSLRNIPMPEIDPMPPVRFAPIPLLSGVALSEGEETKIVNKVEVTITCEDGTARTITLDERNGGWWVPKDRLDG